MLPTPDISHFTSKDYENFYEPAEDSFLFLDCLENEKEFIIKSNPVISLEIGCGSGIVTTFLASLMSSCPIMTFVTDINVKAAEAAQCTARQNHVTLLPVLTDLSSAFLPRLEGKVDVLLFNPPYVVTPSHEVGSQGIEASWAGGTRGREVIDRFLSCMPRLLSPHGVCYLVIIKENGAEEIRQLMAKEGLQMDIVISRKSGPEKLSVLKFTRQSCQVT